MLQFLAPELPGIFVVQEQTASGSLVDALNQLADDVGIRWQFRQATPARITLEMINRPDVCSLLISREEHDKHGQVLAKLGESRIAVYSRINDLISMAEVKALPPSQRLSFGHGLQELLIKEYRIHTANKLSLQTAVQQVQMGRASVLFTTQLSIYSMQPAPLLRRVASLDTADNLLVCSTQLPTPLRQKLQQALQQVIIPFSL